MKLYVISGVVLNGAYREKTFLLDEMKEKETCYEGLGRRIPKEKINVVSPSTLKNGFELFVLKEEDIEVARQQVHEACLAITKDRYQQAKADFEQANAYSFPPVTILKKENRT